MPGLELLFVLATFAGDEPWPSIDDTVMGGRSASEMRIDAGTAAFTGNVSLENGGGFASVRSQPRDHDHDGHHGVPPGGDSGLRRRET